MQRTPHTAAATNPSVPCASAFPASLIPPQRLWNRRRPSNGAGVVLEGGDGGSSAQLYCADSDGVSCNWALGNERVGGQCQMAKQRALDGLSSESATQKVARAVEGDGSSPEVLHKDVGDGGLLGGTYRLKHHRRNCCVCWLWRRSRRGKIRRGLRRRGGRGQKVGELATTSKVS